MACGSVHFVLQCYTETWRENNPSLSVWSFPLQNRALCCGGSDQVPRWMDAVFIGPSTKWGQESLQGRAGDLSSKLIDLHSSTLRSWKRQVLSFLGQTYLFTWLFFPHWGLILFGQVTGTQRACITLTTTCEKAIVICGYAVLNLWRCEMKQVPSLHVRQSALVLLSAGNGKSSLFKTNHFTVALAECWTKHGSHVTALITGLKSAWMSLFQTFKIWLLYRNEHLWIYLFLCEEQVKKKKNQFISSYSRGL